MILYWKDSNYAKYLKLGVQVKGIIYEGKRPDAVILTKEEHVKLVHNKDPVLDARGREYLHDLLSVSFPHNVIIAQ